eukprot:2579561-Pyramimonas_sp.AAC.1
MLRGSIRISTQWTSAVSPAQYSALWGPPTDGPSDRVYTRPPSFVQRFVPPKGVPPKARMAGFTCVSPAQYSASWPNHYLH